MPGESPLRKRERHTGVQSQTAGRSTVNVIATDDY
jgi:hypothetical protein